MPVLVLRTGAYPLAVGFDLRSGLIYGQNHQNQLIVFDDQAIKLKEYNLTGDPNKLGSTRQFLVHPDGRRILVLGDDHTRTGTAGLWYVELPSK